MREVFVPSHDAATQQRPRVKPRLRGIPDVFGALVAIPATILLTLHAQAGVATSAAAVYGTSLIFLLTASATYHVPMWKPHRRRWLRRIDHSAIFVLIAGTYTPISLLVLGGSTGHLIFELVWGAAALGVVKSLLWPKPPRALNAAFYIALGWFILPFAPALGHALATSDIVLLFAGGLLYSIGAAAYVKRWPDPAPRVFGYHEVFHLFVLAAAVCHYVVVWHVVG